MKFWYTKEEDEKEAAKRALQEENHSRKTVIIIEKMSCFMDGKKEKLAKNGRKP
jgi:hypothetical protein